MDIGVPKEIKDQEYRVGLSPSSVRALCERGHRVSVQTNAGAGAGFEDADYERAGAAIASAADVWDRELVVKVKEPLPEEYDRLQPQQLLFTFLHLAADRGLTAALMASGVTAVAYETVELPSGKLPLLMPMSVIAGRLAVQFGAHFLERAQGGRGVLLGGVPGVAPGQVVVLGGGTVGTEAARIALGLGARVQILDVNIERLSELETLFGSRAELLYSTSAQLEAVLPAADLVVGAVLAPGKRPPTLLTRDRVRLMPPGTAIVDVAVDQGGCVENLRLTSHSHPTYREDDVLHCGVPNLPGAVPRTATQALNNSTLPYVLRLAQHGYEALKLDLALGKGLNVREGRLVHPAVKETFPDL
ncbi:alanine dehydrogenase [Rubidibacter lacunae KORDI 51-2]|uniref:Alanine dehydrogenase n=1 Tax=Rubidibacter lacunae KORDI 51-2 TaxID=582515 RepID=U5DKU0_9CHRO|nr:alanine dehydrogenase [Rubidibacter lacunae]ERN41174.1 alanine dehydrogenase [Rubidibacter lacunae KORDI 51-2]